MTRRKKRLLDEKMKNISTRISSETLDALEEESALFGRTISETLRIILHRHLENGGGARVVQEGINELSRHLRELGRDLETVTRLFLVTMKLATEEDAKAWCRENLRAGS